VAQRLPAAYLIDRLREQRMAGDRHPVAPYLLHLTGNFAPDISR